MRILIATDAFPPTSGGSGWSTYELAKGLRDRGHHLVVVQPYSTTAPTPYDGFDVLGYRVTAPPVPFVQNYFRNERLYRHLGVALRTLIREHSIDLIHAQHELTGPASVRAARAAGIPSVCTIRDYWPLCYWSDLVRDPAAGDTCPGCSAAAMTRCLPPRAGAAWPLTTPFIPYMRANLRTKQEDVGSADAIVAVSAQVASYLRERSPEIAAGRLEVIPNGVDIARTRALVAAAARPMDEPYAVFIGKLARNKGVSALAEVVERAKLKMPLVVIGDGPERARLLDAASRSGTDIRVRQWMERDEVFRWLGHAEFLIFPSNWPEPLSRVLLEASALSRPIAAMNTGGTGDVVVDEVTGLLSASSGELADDLARLAGDAGLRARLGSAAGRRAEERFDVPVIVGRMEAVRRRYRARPEEGRTGSRVTREGQSLRVAVVARSVYPLHRFGGLERHVYDLVRCLLARDVQITLLTPPAAANRPADAAADAVFRHPNFTMRSVPYTTFPFANRRGTTILDRSTAYPLFGQRAGRLAARMVSAGEIDIVHGLGASVLGYATADLDAGMRAPLVFNPQGLEEFGATDPSRAPLKRLGYWPLRAAVRRSARSADRVIATDRSLVGPVITHLGVSKDVVRVIPNAIEPAECDRPDAPSQGQALRAEIGLQPDDVLLLSVGRLEANKGFEVLIRALAALVQQKALPARWRWVLVGDGPMRDVLRRTIASEGLSQWVVMRGRASGEDLHGRDEAATLFVHPTLYEGSSIVTLEAMAHRRAVVASRAGGLPDKVVPGVSGWLVPPGNEEALSAAIAKALSDPSRLNSMGAAGRALVEKDFSWRAATDRLMTLYEDVLAQRNPL